MKPLLIFCKDYLRASAPKISGNMKKTLFIIAGIVLSASALAQEVMVAEVTNNDSDGDQIVDTVDIDDDNDGILDTLEIAEDGRDKDSDRDGQPDRLDLDSDNDGILDWKESGAVISINFSNLRVIAGRIVGEAGENGLHDAIETSPDSGRPAYELKNTDRHFDNIPDFLDLDSDNDGLPDIVEAGVDAQFDNNGDGRIDAAPGTVGADGILDSMQAVNDRTCCDVTGDGIEDAVPLNTDGGDLPDFQDLDSDNDGVFDLVEAGGSDFDRDGRIDNFFDFPVVDGLDDALLAIPLWSGDENGNGVLDHLDEFVQAGNAGPAESETNVPNNPVQDGDASDDTEALFQDDEQVSEQENNIDGALDDDILANDDQSDVDDAETRPEDPLLAAAMDAQIEGSASNREPIQRPQLVIEQTMPQDDDPTTGLVKTGLNAGGCSIYSTGTDWLLLIMSVLALTIIGWRYSLRRRRMPAK